MLLEEGPSVMRDKTYHLLSVFFILAASLGSINSAFAQTNPAISKMYGDIGLTSNYVDRGITQSNKTISLGAGLGYWFGAQGRIGFESASVNFPNESANVEIRAFGEYKFVFNPNADLKVRDDLVRYFAEGTRNKMQVTLDQNLFGYHFLVSREDNFEGTKNPRNWFALHHDWPLGSSSQINATVGYSMVEGYNSYFDGLFGVSYLMSNVILSLSTTYVSSAEQFNGMANQFFIFGLNAKF